MPAVVNISAEEQTAKAAVPQWPELRPVTALRSVGGSLAEKLARLRVRTVQDLLFLLPLRYEDRTRVTPIGAVRAGERAVIEGTVELADVVFRRRRQLLCRIADGSGAMLLRFFYFTAAQQAGLIAGTRVRCFGEARRGQSCLEIIHPEYRRVGEATTEKVEESLTPVYPATEGLQQGRLRQLTAAALQELHSRGVCDWLPAALLRDLGLPSLQEALQFLHRPPPNANLEWLLAGRHPAQRRLAFEELLAQHLSLLLLRRDVRQEPGWGMSGSGDLVDRFLQTLPFKLTGAQLRAWHEIENDLAATSPMLRLVQGDVGCGKTIVAALAALRAIENGFQAAVLAPTELLAEQHARNFVKWLQEFDIPVVLLTSRLGARSRSKALETLRSGAGIAVGTHALFQEGVEFKRLGLAVIDEQHRFGVHQRLLLREKGLCEGRYPHQLIMTATPIPRTLAMTAYADLDVTVIDELPPGRTAVRTVALPETRRADVVMRIHEACSQGRQAYWVCTLIEESDQLEAQAAEQTAEVLKQALPDIRIELIHGRSPAAHKDAVMEAFKAGRIDLLVATTVIEVGVDVPNASLMVIENAERMGLAQLHQLRGRVGRGVTQSNCVLLYKPSLSEIARERLAVMRSTNDGFEISRRDLELRGPGELLGTKQTGLMQMRIADLMRDADLLPQVHKAAQLMLDAYPDNIAPLLTRWVGDAERFGKV